MTHETIPSTGPETPQRSAEAHGWSRPTNVRWMIVAMLMGFTFLGHFNRVSIAVAAKARFIGPGLLSEVQMGFVYSAFLWTYTFSMLPGGWVIDRIGPRLSMAGMGLGLGFGVALTGALGWSGLPIAALFIPLLVVRSIAGFLSTPLHPGAARSVFLWLPLTSRTTANGLVTAGALVGIALSYPGFGWLMDQYDWSTAFVICGTVMMLFTVVWLLYATDDAADHPRANAEEKRLVALNRVAQACSKITMSDSTALFRNRPLVALGSSYAAYGYFQYLFFYWIDYYFGTELKLPGDSSRRATFIVMIAMAIGMAAGGFISDKLSHRIGVRLGYRTIAVVGMSLSAVFAWFGVAATDPNHVVLFFSLALASLGMCEGLFWTSATALEPMNGGLACAFINTFGNGGGILAPVCTPLIGQYFGWPAAIGTACCMSLAGAVLWFWIDVGKQNLLGLSD
jgi:ACS family D-galactonate transporter-like MFS transporter